MKTKGTSLVARVAFSLLLCGIMMFWGIQALGEEWTGTQKEVWSAIKSHWDKYQQGDLDGIEAGIHDDALILFNSIDTPQRKVLIMGAYSRRSSDYTRPATYELIPYGIQIFGDIANVFYFFKWKAKSKFSGSGRALVSLKKQNGKWLIISSIHDECERLPLCLD